MLTKRPAREMRRYHFMHPSTHLAQHARREAPGESSRRPRAAIIVDRDGTRFLDAFAGL